MAETFPERALRCAAHLARQRNSPANGPLTAFKDHLLKRWEEGCHNALQLWREVKEQGFGGDAAAVRDFLRPLRQPGMTPALKRAERTVPSMRALSWLLMLPNQRTPEQTAMVETLASVP